MILSSWLIPKIFYDIVDSNQEESEEGSKDTQTVPEKAIHL